MWFNGPLRRGLRGKSEIRQIELGSLRMENTGVVPRVYIHKYI